MSRYTGAFSEETCPAALLPELTRLDEHGKTLTCNASRSLVVLSLIEYGFSVWPSTINSSLGLVLSLLVTLVSVYYVDADRSTGRAGNGEVVVPMEWADVEGKGGKAE